MIIVAITGASGTIYGIRILESLSKKKETALLVTSTASKILEYETGLKLSEIKRLADHYFDVHDFEAPISSGSFNFEAMIIAPCSMKTLAAIAQGYTDNTITRAADVSLKEKRKLILVPRETPLRSIHLENMLKVSREGGIILPAMPGFYHKPKNIDDMVNFIAGKALDLLGVENSLFKRWTGYDTR
ncbi:MAG TPA: UbiX family flavin prenyltransferase [Methanobacteriales archaeon]|nr:MAG: 3-octaprenyl-4-hydroxybenzoate carboxy-lyase [Methanobacteriaceae archaeon 41_258]MBC7089774.1 UbiX family flavin prenyltransferase [Methanobacteriaceae archaeon]MBC7097152.1 UbiX family flavin prenyltransferase [Methanobacteriales archaeon]HIH61291.1 UbiX family flavin prenyltransferase [Methanobacteriales archaeon]